MHLFKCSPQLFTPGEDFIPILIRRTLYPTNAPVRIYISWAKSPYLCYCVYHYSRVRKMVRIQAWFLTHTEDRLNPRDLNWTAHWCSFKRTYASNINFVYSLRRWLQARESAGIWALSNIRVFAGVKIRTLPFMPNIPLNVSSVKKCCVVGTTQCACPRTSILRKNVI